MNTILIDKTNLDTVQKIENKLFLKVKPITFLKGEKRANPRLPRKSSKQTNLQQHTTEIFCLAFNDIENYFSEIAKFRVEICVYKSTDKQGGADLDNYCKAILDAVTQTKKVWKDDSQIDQVYLQRLYKTEFPYSHIELTISKI